VSFLKVGLVFLMMLTVTGGVSRASQDDLTGENEKAGHAVVPQSSGSNSAARLEGDVQVARRPSPLPTQFVSPTLDPLCLEIAALYDEDPYNIRCGNGYFSVEGTGILYAWGIE
jgi:hypothetical protein